MPGFEAFLTLLDSRSFGSVWFWVLVILGWTMAGRRILGVPWDVVTAVGKPGHVGGEVAALALLDWLSLTLPRWQVSRGEGAFLLGAGCFLLTLLAILGFGYGLEMAQALVLALAPFAGLFLLDLRLARRLRLVLEAARAARPVAEAGAEAARLMRRHRLSVLAVSAVAIMVTAFFAAVWMALHPYGY